MFRQSMSFRGSGFVPDFGLTFDRYDLDLDKKLSEETTVLVENYTVSRFLSSTLTALM